MCANDTMAISAIKHINLLGFKVPDNISIIGFDDINIASQISPALTTISVPVDVVAEQSVKQLLSILHNNEQIYQHAVLPCQLVCRDSSKAQQTHSQTKQAR